MSKFKLKKITHLLFLIALTFSPIFATPAEAQWVTWDPGNFATNVTAQIKDFGLDAIAYRVVNQVLEKMTASTVKWINTGFKGSPAFVTDPEAYFTDLGDKVAGDFIFRNPGLNFLCSNSMSVKIKLALSKSYLKEKQWKCTLTDVAGNLDDFVNDFDKGGWDKFFKLSQTRQNPLGMFIQADVEMNERMAQSLGMKREELNQGKGFMSWKTCDLPLRDASKESIYNADGSLKPFDPTADYSGEGGCTPGHEKTNTPGSVISDKLNNVLGTGENRIAAADEINELISALLSQLTSQIVGGIGKGLRGLSQPDVTNQNNRAFTDQLTNYEKDQAISAYFEVSSTTVTETLEMPPVAPTPCSANQYVPGCVPDTPPANTTIPGD